MGLWIANSKCCAVANHISFTDGFMYSKSDNYDADAVVSLMMELKDILPQNIHYMVAERYYYIYIAMVRLILGLSVR